MAVDDRDMERLLSSVVPDIHPTTTRSTSFLEPLLQTRDLSSVLTDL